MSAKDASAPSQTAFSLLGDEVLERQVDFASKASTWPATHVDRYKRTSTLFSVGCQCQLEFRTIIAATRV
jgi:hypothetical protein